MPDLATGVILCFIYPVVLISLSTYASRGKEVTVDSYFFANRNVHWLKLGVSAFAASLVSPYIFGLKSSGLSCGMVLEYAAISIVLLVIFGRLIVPKYLSLRMNTISEFFERRFGKKCYRFLSALYILLNIGIRLPIIFSLERLFLNAAGVTDSFSLLLFFLVVTGVYVIIGGLKAEVHADMVQVVLLVLSIVGFTSWLIGRTDGLSAVTRTMSSQIPFAAGGDPEFTRLGLLVGFPIIGFWFWCADQFIVQKVMSIRNPKDTTKILTISGGLQILPVLIFVLFGAASLVAIRPEEPAAILPALFSNNLLPTTVRSLFIAAAISVFMITVANALNSTSSLVTFDFFRSFRPDSSGRKLVLIGRMSTVVLVFVSICLIPISESLDLTASLRLFETFCYFCAMMVAVLIAGLVNRKFSDVSTMVVLCVSILVIVLRVVLQMILRSGQLIGNDSSWFVNLGFLEFSVFIFVVSLVLIIVFDFLWSRYQIILRKMVKDAVIMGTFSSIFWAIVRIGTNLRRVS